MVEALLQRINSIGVLTPKAWTPLFFWSLRPQVIKRFFALLLLLFFEFIQSGEQERRTTPICTVLHKYYIPWESPRRLSNCRPVCMHCSIICQHRRLSSSSVVIVRRHPSSLTFVIIDIRHKGLRKLLGQIFGPATNYTAAKKSLRLWNDQVIKEDEHLTAKGGRARSRLHHT